MTCGISVLEYQSSYFRSLFIIPSQSKLAEIASEISDLPSDLEVLTSLVDHDVNASVTYANGLLFGVCIFRTHAKFHASRSCMARLRPRE